MEQEEMILKKCSKIALIALGILLIGAILSYKERMLFADSACTAFTIINNNKFAIQESRFGSFISQLLPYIGAQMHLPVKALLISFSASFYIFYLSVACLLIFGYRQYRLAILLGLFYFLFCSASYFWSSELPQAIAWMFLFFGTILYMGEKRVNIIIHAATFLLLGYLTISTHFISIIPTVFLWVYFIVEQKKLPFSRNTTISFSCIIALIILFKIVSASSHTSYDSEPLHGITHFSIKDILQTFSTPVIKIFLYRCLVNYWVAFIIFIAGLISLWKNKQPELAFWSIISFFGYLIIMGLAYGHYDKNFRLAHIESEWLSLGIIMGTPFVFSFLPKLNPKHAACILIVVFAVRFGYISAAYPAFHWRIQFEEHVLTQMKQKGINKLAMYDDDTTINNKWILSWAFPFESMLATAMNSDTLQRTFAFINRDEKQTIADLTNPKNTYLVFSMMQPGSINNRYFNIDTTTPYRVMEYKELMR